MIATFTGFEADLLRSLASQLVELLRNEAALATRLGVEADDDYNHHRPHSAIGKAAPITRLDNLAGHHT